MTALSGLVLTSYSQYVLLVPTVVRSDSPQTACVQFHSLSEPLSLSIILEYGSIRKTLFEESVTRNDYFKCHEFKVPPAASDPLAFISFSAKGPTVNLAERRSVAIQNVDSTVFIQTDKPIYKPGQKVMFRVVALDSQFRPVQETYPRITIEDPEQNKIFQWLDVAPKHGIVQLSFPLIPEPILGSYHIMVERKSGENKYQYFTVEEYVLPKFEVTTSVPQRISFFDEEIRVNVCASYTYGQPVQGNAQINVCQQHFYYPRCERNQKEACEAVTGLLGKDGCLNTVISIKIFQLYRRYTRMYASLNVESIVTENGTGIQMKGYDYVAVNEENDRVIFKNMDLYYKRGIPYYGEISVTKMDGEPIPNRTVLLELNEEYLANYTTDENGTAAFSIDTSNFFDPNLKLRVRQAPDDCEDFLIWSNDNEPQALFFVQRFYSRTNSFVKIEPVKEQLSCHQQRRIKVHYVLNREGYRNARHTNFYYVLQLEFSEKQGLPGSKVSLHLEAAANSYCALRTVDQSVLLLQPEQELSAESVYYQLSVGDLYSYYYNGINLEDDKPEGCTPVKTTFFDGLYYEPVNVSHDGDVYRIFRDMGLKVFTNSVLRKPVLCNEDRSEIEDHPVYFDHRVTPFNVHGIGEVKFTITAEAKLNTIGYQKQLSYKHRDGSYSSFGTRDREGSVWLTAFVYKSFAQARRYIYIDDNVQSQSLIWLASKQKSDGCFENAGSHFNNALKGGEEGEYSLTAYVVAALLEHPIIQSGMNCLETAFGNGVNNLYNQALFAYAYGLAGKEKRRQFFLEKLDKTATRDGSFIHWQRENKPPAEYFPVFYSRAPSAEIEMTSYVLLAMLNRTKLTPEDLSYISRIVHWLVKQQNPYGGFSSSQDTVVALQALAQYGYLTFSKKSLNTVKINFMKSPSETFQVNDNNRFLLQQASLPTIPGNYSVEVNGTGCVYLQTTLRYNVHLPKKVAGFSLSVWTANVSCTSNFPPKFDLVLSTSYTGNRSVSNMAIIDVKMLSGFVPIRSSLEKLQYQNSVVDRIDTKDNHIFFYLQNVSQKEISFSFSMEQSLPVSDIKPVPVHIYDYYETVRKMWLKFLLAILLLHVTAAKEPEPQYVLMVPAVLQSDSPGQICLQFLDLNETIFVRVILEYGAVNTTIFEKTMTASSGLQCFNFTIVPVSSVPLAFISFSAKGITVSLEERRSVMIWNMESIVFVQTDKPIYKPGQSVMFRVVALDFNFKPVQEMDPRGNRIFQWQNVTSEVNIIQIEFPLTEEPIMGNYKIVVVKKSGDKTNHSFLVEQYVLPKFDVTVTAPESLTVLDSEFTVKVCGVYTYGQPVEGKVQLSVCRDFDSYGRCKKMPVCQSFTKDLETEGCLSQVFSSNTFELNRIGYLRNLDVKAIVTEKGTGLQHTATQSISITRIMSSIEFENMDRHYRRGIPYFGQIKLVGKDNSPISNEVIQLFVNNKNVDNFTTDNNGVAPFSIDTSEMFDPEINLRATYKTNEQCHSEGWIEPFYPDASLFIQRFYSWTSSFVRIEPYWKDLSCGKKRMITVHYILNTEGYKSINTRNFYYVGMAKGKIVLTGEIKVNIQADQTGTFTIPLMVNEKMAPSLRLLVYTLHPARELVADSVRFPVEKCFKNKIYSLHPLQDFQGYIFNGLNLEDDPQDPCVLPDNIFHKGLYYTPVMSGLGPDVYHFLRINVLLSDSLAYQAKLISPEDDGCVCAKQRKTHVWNIFSKEIGNIVFSITAETKNSGDCGDKAPRNISIDYRDTQIRTLLVEGGVDNELSLSAYITIAMLEAGHSSLHPVARNSFFCLETASKKNISDVYTQALMAYAFCLAGKAEKCESFLRVLQKSAKETDGSQHWEQEERSPSEKSPSFLDHASSAEVEITSYVLLALLYKPNRNQDDLTKASQIVQWIIRQQNPYGGFSSTQDTVIALQALAAYSEATYNSVTQNVVMITSKKPFEKVFIVNNVNRLLLQQSLLPEVPGKYSQTVNGSGCVLMQTALRYNIHLPKGAFGFSLSVQTSNASCPLDRPAKFDIVIISSYTGKRSSTNMVIIDVKMLSGFLPVKSSLDKFPQKKRKQIIFSVEQDFIVNHPKPAPLQIYDYYETEEYAVAQYTSPCKESVAEMD
ncbi:ovostatin [Columba guinea]|nr:ovostatin [Columba guinea]